MFITQLHHLQKFLSMGGYAFYVWISYSLTLFVLVGHCLWTRRRKKRIIETIQKKLMRQQAYE